ncbi:hypothetical protein CTA2_491 [Colletotrichum tanaceti]|uniref:Uncharacterized protein n=1 Tax=Colletotrichum tanaceti TaxID=1306861 RepID=A0A4U6XEQ3_9PEZI|nr:hypothetical protein CTA2_491 [Colletotrichum tanaceti]TKW53769.1 hypothetical protein CTA1_3347 [Colletotrichum tanaceti]
MSLVTTKIAPKRTEDVRLSSYNALYNARQPPRLSPEAQRLFWTLDGPLADAVWIMKNKRDPSSLEPYSQGETWHPFSQAPLTEPKVSSITVRTNELIPGWDDMCFETHRGHGNPCCDDDDDDDDDDGSLFALWGDLLCYEPEEDEEGPTHLLGGAVSVVVKPTVAPFVTIHDYLSVVHPWLLSSRGDLLAAMAVMAEGLYSKPLPAETKLTINIEEPHLLVMCEQADRISGSIKPQKTWSSRSSHLA